jgi:uncharacterized repeat protein (TIGR02543 family)
MKKQKEKSKEKRTYNNQPGSYHRFLFFMVCCFFIITCSINNDYNVIELPQGMGSITINFTDSTSRTIMPSTSSTPNLSYFDNFEIFFTPTLNGAQRDTVDADQTQLDASNRLSPIVLVPGTYNIRIDAFKGTVLSAQGTTTGIVITEGANTPVTITLRMSLLHGEGTYEWDISMVGITGLNTATMTIRSLDDKTNTPNDVALPHSRDLNIPANRQGQISLFSGLYSVEIELVEDESRLLKWYEILHVYSTLTSNWTTAFTNDHFFRTHYNVTFNYNDLAVPNPGIQSYIHGSNIMSRDLPVALPRPDYLFIGWFENLADTISWDINAPIYRDITLFAKWQSTATIEIDIDPIPDFRPEFQVSLNAEPFIAIVPVANPILLSRTGVIHPNILHFRVSSTGHDSGSVVWEVFGTGGSDNIVVQQNTFTLNISNSSSFTLGGHSIRLTVKKDEVPYMVNIPFTIAQ